MFFVWPSVATALLRNYCQNWWDWVGGHLEHCYLLYPTCLYLRACYKPINHPLGTASFTLLSGLCPKLEASVVRASNRAVGRAFDNTWGNNLLTGVPLLLLLLFRSNVAQDTLQSFLQTALLGRSLLPFHFSPTNPFYIYPPIHTASLTPLRKGKECTKLTALNRIGWKGWQ